MSLDRMAIPIALTTGARPPQRPAWAPADTTPRSNTSNSVKDDDPTTHAGPLLVVIHERCRRMCEAVVQLDGHRVHVDFFDRGDAVEVECRIRPCSPA